MIVQQGDLHNKKRYCFLSEVLRNRHCNGFVLFSFVAPFKEAVTQASELKESCNTLEVIGMGRSQGGGSGFRGRERWGSGVGGVDGGFVA